MRRRILFLGLFTIASTVSFISHKVSVCYASSEEAEEVTNRYEAAIKYESVDGNDYPYIEGILPSEDIKSKVSIDFIDEYGMGQIYLSFNDLEYCFEDYTYYISDAYYIPGDLYSYVIIASIYDNDWTISHLFKITDEEIEYLNSLTMGTSEVNTYEDSIFVNGTTRVNIFGTYYRQISAEVKEDLLTYIDAPYYELDTYAELTTKIPVKAAPVIMTEDESEFITIESGSVIIPIAINTEESTFIVSYNENLCAIPFEENYVTDEEGYTYLESRTIEGISEYDVFESLPYAG